MALAAVDRYISDAEQVLSGKPDLQILYQTSLTLSRALEALDQSRESLDKQGKLDQIRADIYDHNTKRIGRLMAQIYAQYDY